jgi:GxxExxY protein
MGAIVNEGEFLYQVVGLAMAIHGDLGPDHAEIVYHRAMLDALGKDGISVADRPSLPVRRSGKLLVEYQPDTIARKDGLTLILEYKAETRLHNAALRQVRAYLSAYAEPAVGLLINFGGPSLAWRQVRASRLNLPTTSRHTEVSK